MKKVFIFFVAMFTMLSVTLAAFLAFFRYKKDTYVEIYDNGADEDEGDITSF